MLFGQYFFIILPLPHWTLTLTEQRWQEGFYDGDGGDEERHQVCPFSPLVFHLNYLSSEVWRGLDKMQAEQPESYSRILEESVQWQNKANSVPEPYKVNHDDWSICLSNSSLNCFLSLPFLSFPFPCSKMGFLSRPESRKVQNKKNGAVVNILFSVSLWSPRLEFCPTSTWWPGMPWQNLASTSLPLLFP